MKIQDPKRYRLNDEWWSVRQLKKKVILDPDPVIIFPEMSETPW